MGNSDQDRGRGSAGNRLGSVRDRMGRWLGRSSPADEQTTSASARDGGLTVTLGSGPPGTRTPKPGDTASRAGEPARTRFRSDRIVSENGVWYIATREGINVGPYDDPETARREARRLAKLLAEQSELGAEEQALTIRRFMNRPTFGKP